MIKSIINLNLFSAGNFDSNRSVNSLALIMANSPKLNKVDISGQIGERKIGMQVNKYETVTT